MAERFFFGPFELDSGRGVLTRDGAPLAPGNRALSILQALVGARGQVVTKAELMAAGWAGMVVEEANLSVQIAALRKLLGEAPQAREWIATVARVGYRFVGPLRVEEADRPRVAAPAKDAAEKPSIVVLPFTNLSGEAGQDYFADGITEDIISALSRFRWFFVIGRNSSFALKKRAVGLREIARELGVRYVLEGSVRSSGERTRITVALNDAASEKQIWADRYEFALADMFAVQDQIVQQVSGALEPELLRSESRRGSDKPRGGNVSAWDLVRQGTYSFHGVTRDTHLRARELFREAVRKESELPDAHIWLARVSAGLVAYGWSDDPEQDLREGIAAALEAIKRDERSPYSHYALAITSAYAGEPTRAIRAAERALELNPSFALGYLVLGMGRLFAGHAAAAAEAFKRGLGMNPYDPQNAAWYTLLAYAHYFACRPDEALRSTQRAWDIRQDWRPTLEIMACCHLALKQPEAAAQRLEQMRRLPSSTDHLLKPLKTSNPQWRVAIEQKLQQAGWRNG
jgi:TolB-like protein